MPLVLLLALACRPPLPPPEAPGPPGVPVGPGTLPPPPPPLTPAPSNTWRSASCHARGYERVITLNPDFSYALRDLVSPCPEGATCIWSGVVEAEGTWAAEADGALQLTEAEALSGDQGQPRPKRLTWTDGALTEPHADGDCVYTRG